ncbi:putative HTH-type transcriptional regulator YwnA [Clostridium puniceum]|uniref:Putative HTH-type transcriptional regulator YwnA n=1 Tax=Clostridium puniceum TaxID=29367 RepID=A0A1S8TAC2_9CLOT|nr:Rrf2 family transcriptional regulator [Clostridium puniceum]OOM74703.1 putative HTH-type transcriptional regulator YwnA [Clostridium puniceum]
MSISSRFSVGIHILTLLGTDISVVKSSELIAGSVNTNPVVIRKIMGMLKAAGLVKVRPGIAGAELTKNLSEITLLDVYKAVNVVQEKELFSVHENPNPACLVGRNIQSTIIPVFSKAQQALEKELENITLKDIITDIKEKNELQNNKS